MDGVIINGAKRQRRKKWYIVSDIQVVVGQFVYVTKIDDSTCLEEWDGICGSQIKYHDIVVSSCYLLILANAEKNDTDDSA